MIDGGCMGEASDAIEDYFLGLVAPSPDSMADNGPSAAFSLCLVLVTILELPNLDSKGPGSL